MADYAPPSGPPPPKVPEGWKAIWNDQYKEWFYVNTYTKQSQWDKPTEPIYPPGESTTTSTHGGLPAYDHGTGQSVGPEKGAFVSSNTAPSGAIGGPSSQLTEDEKFARKLQEEENNRMAGGAMNTGGAASGYYSQPGQTYNTTPYQSSQPTVGAESDRSKGKAGGLLGKLLSKATGKQPQQQAYGSPQTAQGYAYPPNQGYHSQPGYPPQGYPMGGGYHPPGRKPGGMGMGGAAALGAGGGLMGGMMLANAMDGGDDGGYGGHDGGGYGGDDGGGFGGDDGGGGDFGGD